MSLNYYLLYLLLATGTVLTPGPAVLYTIANTLNHGVRQAVAGFFGVALGILGVAAIASLLVMSMVALGETGYRLLALAGAGYLLWLACRAWHQDGVAMAQATVKGAHHSYFLRGVLISLFNPKAIVFFTSLLPQFVTPSAPLLPQCVLLGGSFSLIVLLVHTGYCTLFYWVGRRWQGDRFARRMNRISALLFGGFGCLMLWRALA